MLKKGENQNIDDYFRETYEKFFIERFVFSTAEVEELTNHDQRIRLETDVLNAYEYLLNHFEDLNLGTIRHVGDLVNDGYDIPAGFRRIGVTAGEKAEFEPAKPYNIINDLNNLLYNYYHFWPDLDVYLKEAMFHINFMRIHPFEDGNKRCAKLITTTNLCKQGFPPIIITKEDTDEYYRFLNDCDYEGFAEFINQRANLENNTLCGIYRIIYGMSMFEDVDPKQVRNKVKIMKP